MSDARTLDDIGDVAGKRVLVRVDLNVPMKDGAVSDSARLVAIKPTVTELAGKGAKVILLAHFGRPKGERIADMSLKPVVGALSETLGLPVSFADDCIGEAAATAVAALPDGGVLVLENTRYHKGEEKNDEAFIDQLAANGDLYVNDAFSAAHRAHASTEGLARRLPAFAGRSMEAELAALSKALGAPKRPVMAVIGGAKVSTKIALLENLVTKVDALVVGGGMANTFLHALGIDVGHSLKEADMADTARRIMTAAERAGCAIMLPKDAIAAEKFEADAPSIHIGVDEGVDHDKMILDVGGRTVHAINEEMDHVNTLVWNGPLGAFELHPFDRGTVAVARHAAKRTKAGMLSVAGGGDTVAALSHAGVADDFSYLSTAGGAFLEWLEGKPLPGVDALKPGE
ncbi:phosphoglycerate kinase [Acuticoccus yangtzensis]|uniref:phosphoglycerate kinase n=1 Tax=Acuticoccus yangtzensis TaxID=1443441 RepID=UPI000949A103|nr:phosphoglycerate kinase [Acuticoccus yangtzensis]